MLAAGAGSPLTEGSEKPEATQAWPLHAKRPGSVNFNAERCRSPPSAAEVHIDTLPGSADRYSTYKCID
jgi:hypothetical protein